MPIADADGYVEGVGSVVEWDKPKARLVFSTLQSDEPLVKPQRAARATVPPGQVRVQVLNGSSVSGLATRASDALSARGFAIGAPAGNADRTDVTTTVIQYDPAWDESLKTVQAAFPGAKVEEVAGLGETFRHPGRDRVHRAQLSTAGKGSARNRLQNGSRRRVRLTQGRESGAGAQLGDLLAACQSVLPSDLRLSHPLPVEGALG